MSQPLITVIIPVYNAEQFISQCIESVLAQKFTNFELLLINDGSIDKSGELCEVYSHQDNRILVFHKKNEGVSAARNLGINNAKGDYITFIDADDWIEVNYLQNFLDIISCDSKLCVQWAYRELLNGDKILCDKDVFLASVWGNLFERKIINNKNLLFDVAMNIGEDTMFNLVYLQYVDGVSEISQPSYHYREHSSSLTNSVSINSLFLFYRSLESIELEPYISSNVAFSSFVSRHKNEQRQELYIKLKRLKEDVNTEFIKNHPEIVNIFLPIFDYQEAEIKKLQDEILRLRLSFSCRLGKFLLKPFHFIKKEFT